MSSDRRESDRRDARDHIRRTKHHLEEALDEDDVPEKNYYIRLALQDLVIDEDDIRR